MSLWQQSDTMWITFWSAAAAAAAAKLLQLCPTPCDPIDGSPPGSAIPGIPQARTLEWVTIQFSSVQSLSRVWLFTTPWIAARQASLSITNSRSSPRLTSIESVIPSSHLILCRPLLLLPPIPPSIRVFSNESTLRMRWPLEKPNFTMGDSVFITLILRPSSKSLIVYTKIILYTPYEVPWQCNLIGILEA